MFNTLELKPVLKREEKTFLKKLKMYINKRIHLKIEHDDMPISYVMTEVGKDYIVVVFGDNERIVPLSKILFFQVESKVHYPHTL